MIIINFILTFADFISVEDGTNCDDTKLYTGLSGL